MADAEHEEPDLQALGRKWLELGQAYLASLAGAAPAAGTQARQEQEVGAAPSPASQGMLDAWRRAWSAATAAQAAGAQALSEWLERMPALGPTREQTLLLKELAEAQAECRRLEQELYDVLSGVHAETLELLEERMGASSASAGGTRELYDLWVECGEQVYAKVAHSEGYCRLLGALGNATMCLRARQQAMIEYLLKQFDLPTRSELNTLHRQIRELRQKVAALEATRADDPHSAAASKPSGKRTRRRQAGP